jgi:hypothetical protein
MHAPLEDYLAQVEKQLAPLPAEQRKAELREIRLHLQMMIEDYIAIGDSPDEAVAAAVRQFGSASKTGQALQRARRADHLSRWRPLLAGVANYGAYIALYGSFCSFMEAFRFLLPGSMFFPWAYYVVLVLSGVVGGWLAEMIAPRKAIWSVLILHSLILIWMVPSSYFSPAPLLFAAAGLAACFGTGLQQWWGKARKQRALTLSR